MLEQISIFHDEVENLVTKGGFFPVEDQLQGLLVNLRLSPIRFNWRLFEFDLCGNPFQPLGHINPLLLNM